MPAGQYNRKRSRSHIHGILGKFVVRNVYIQTRPSESDYVKWIVAGQWCPYCGFTQSEEMSARQLEALGV